ncbi:MAG: hypothetical protein AUK55_02850 [Syntrophobacteraceae bacterium CG2_30_61_12]|nr:MAG: hypothetical protein AUK55_02850 [Syntrophobacteraceae bacterium CG2_30_61_12]
MTVKQKRRRVVFISGTSSGIGKACAIDLARHGYRVFAGVRSEAAGYRLTARMPQQITPIELDITKAGDIRAAAASIDRLLGQGEGLDVIVNNAGITVPGAVECVALEDVRRQLEVNVIGHVALTQALLPLLRRTRGRIINIGSIMGRFVMPLSGPYAMSKFAMRAINDAWRRELRPWGIDVVLIEPGSVESAIWDKIDSEAAQYKGKLNAAARDRYANIEASLVATWKRAHRMAIPADTVARAIRRSIEKKRPKPHLFVGPDAHGLALVSRFLPDSCLDWMIGKITGR